MSVTLPDPIDLERLEREGVPPVEWLVEPYIARPDLVILVGDGGTSKTFLALDLALGLAAGRPIFGRPVPETATPQRVLFIDEDSSLARIRRRLLYMARGKRLSLTSLGGRLTVYSGVGFRLDTELGQQWLQEAIANADPDLLILDAFRAFHAMDEKSNTAMAVLLRHVLRPIMHVRGRMATLLIHHTNKEAQDVAMRRRAPRDPALAMRGGTDIRNAVDSVLYVEKRSGTPTLFLDKTREVDEGDRPDPLAFRVFSPEAETTLLRFASYHKQPKMAAALAEIEESLTDGAARTQQELFARLGQLQGGGYGRTTALKALELLCRQGRVEQRKEGRSVKYQWLEKAGAAGQPDHRARIPHSRDRSSAQRMPHPGGHGEPV